MSSKPNGCVAACAEPAARYEDQRREAALMARDYTQVIGCARDEDEPADSALKAAVQALDDELDRFEALAEAAQRTPLTSERNLEKAATAINQAAESQQRVHGHIQALIDAISAARVKHDKTAAGAGQDARPGAGARRALPGAARAASPRSARRPRTSRASCVSSASSRASRTARSSRSSPRCRSA